MEMAPPPPKGTREIAVDGSNVLFGGGTSATPRVKNLELVIKELKKAGWKPVVWVDASRKYDVDDPAKLIFKPFLRTTQCLWSSTICSRRDGGGRSDSVRRIPKEYRLHELSGRANVKLNAN